MQRRKVKQFVNYALFCSRNRLSVQARILYGMRQKRGISHCHSGTNPNITVVPQHRAVQTHATGEEARERKDVVGVVARFPDLLSSLRLLSHPLLLLHVIGRMSSPITQVSRDEPHQTLITQVSRDGSQSPRPVPMRAGRKKNGWMRSLFQCCLPENEGDDHRMTKVGASSTASPHVRFPFNNFVSL
jgi:hypothetical protein